jgi:hypothetical protein
LEATDLDLMHADTTLVPFLKSFNPISDISQPLAKAISLYIYDECFSEEMLIVSLKDRLKGYSSERANLIFNVYLTIMHWIMAIYKVYEAEEVSKDIWKQVQQVENDVSRKNYKFCIYLNVLCYINLYIYMYNINKYFISSNIITD